MNGLAQITIDGQPIVLKFGLPALRRIVEKMTQYELIENDQYNELGLSHILYAGYLNACAMKDVPALLTYETFYELIENAEDEATKDEIIGAIRSFEESKFVKAGMAKKKVEKPTK
jgi:hypothetical protein